MSSTDSLFPNPNCKGPYSTIGCVDLMHRHLMVRLFYPTESMSGCNDTTTKWLPSEEYGIGYIEALSSLLPDSTKYLSLRKLMGMWL